MNTTTASSGDLIADRRYQLGRDLAGRGDFSAAADLFAQAAEVAPTFAPAWFALGEARVKLGDRAGAAAAFRQALAIDPGDRCGAALHLARLAPPMRLMPCRAPMCVRCSTNTPRASTKP